MRVLGIDLGSRRIGVAVSDGTGLLTSPRTVLARSGDPAADRRAIVVRARRERLPDLLRLYAGMNRSMNRIYAGYSERELEAIADFLQRTAKAGRTATDQLSELGGESSG